MYTNQLVILHFNFKNIQHIRFYSTKNGINLFAPGHKNLSNGPRCIIAITARR